MNAKKIDQWACNLNAMGCAMLRKNLTSRCHGPAPEQATSGQSPEARTHGGPELAKTQGGDMGTYGVQGLEADRRRTQGGHMARC